MINDDGVAGVANRACNVGDEVAQKQTRHGLEARSVF